MIVCVALLSAAGPAFCPMNPKDPVKEMRLFYWRAGTHKDAIMPFYNAAEDCKEKANPVLKGYLGVATMMRARLTPNVLKKWYLFNKGKVLLERAIQSQPDNVELRFLRLSVQLELPAILDYRDLIESDRAFVMRHIDHFMHDDFDNYQYGEKMLRYLSDKDMVKE